MRKLIRNMVLFAVLAVLYAVPVYADEPVQSWNVGNDSGNYGSMYPSVSRDNCDPNIAAQLFYSNGSDSSDGYRLEFRGSGPMANWSYSYPAPWTDTYGSSIVSVIIDDGITTLGDFVLRGCAITEITIPSSVRSLGNMNTFTDCSGLRTVNYEPVTTGDLPYYCFIRCSSLENITIPAGVTRISPGAFTGCTSLTAINLPESVQSIAAQAFYGCSSLTVITGGSGIREIEADETALDGGAFYTDRPTAITLDDSASETLQNYDWASDNRILNGILFKMAVGNDNGEFSSVPDAYTECDDNIIATISYLNGTDETGGLELSLSGSGTMASWASSYSIPWQMYAYSITQISIADGITTISDSAFANCSRVSSITIPGSVSFIGNNAFSNCRGIESITLAEGTDTIGSYAFSNCTRVSEITIPSTVTNIGQYAFSGCMALTEINGGSGVETVGLNAFMTSAYSEDMVATTLDSSAGDALKNYDWAGSKRDIPLPPSEYDRDGTHTTRVRAVLKSSYTVTLPATVALSQEPGTGNFSGTFSYGAKGNIADNKMVYIQTYSSVYLQGSVSGEYAEAEISAPYIGWYNGEDETTENWWGETVSYAHIGDDDFAVKTGTIRTTIEKADRYSGNFTFMFGLQSYTP